MRHVLQCDFRVTFKSKKTDKQKNSQPKDPGVQPLPAYNVRYLRPDPQHQCAFLAADVGQFFGGA